MSGFQHRIAIVKASGLGSGAGFEPWWGLLETAEARGIPLSIGALAGGLHRGADTDRLAAQIRQQRHELWCQADSEGGAASIVDARARVSDVLGTPPSGFAARGLAPDVLLRLAAGGEFTFAWFPEVEIAIPSIPVSAVLPVEHVDGRARRPELAGFRRRYRDFGSALLAVLEIWPSVWTGGGQEEFARVLDFLLDQNWQVATAADYVGYLREAADPRPFLLRLDEVATGHFERALAEPDAPKKDFTDFYFHRFRRGSDALRGIYARLGWDAPGRCLDIGSGAGNWTFAYAAQSPAHQAVGLDSNEYLVRQAQLISERVGLADRATFVVGSAHELPFERSDFTHVVAYNAVNYFDVERAFEEIYRVLETSGRAYIGIQNTTFNLKGYFDSLMAGNLDGALRRIDQLAYKSAADSGLVGSPAYSQPWSARQLAALAATIGLGPVAVDTPVRERTQFFLGRPLFTTFVFERNPAAGVPDGSVDTALANLFGGGGRAQFLSGFEQFGERATPTPELDRRLVAAGAVCEARGVELPTAVLRARDAQADFADVVRHQLAREYSRAADRLIALAEGDPSLATLSATALYAANRAAEGLELAQHAFPARTHWTSAHWWLWLTLVTAQGDTPRAKAAFAEYLRARHERRYGKPPDARLLTTALSETPGRPRTTAEAEWLSVVSTLKALEDG